MNIANPATASKSARAKAATSAASGAFGLRSPNIRPHITNTPNRLVDEWIAAIGLAPSAYGTHSLRRTKAALIYRKTGNIRAVQLLLGHTKLDSAVRYLGVEVEDALAIAESIDV